MPKSMVIDSRTAEEALPSGSVILAHHRPGKVKLYSKGLEYWYQTFTFLNSFYSRHQGTVEVSKDVFQPLQFSSNGFHVSAEIWNSAINVTFSRKTKEAGLEIASLEFTPLTTYQHQKILFKTLTRFFEKSPNFREIVETIEKYIGWQVLER